MRSLAVVLLVAATARGAEQARPVPATLEDAEERVALSLEMRAGLVEAPFVTTAFPEVSGFGTLVTGAAAVHFPSLGWLRLKVPVSVVRFDFPAGAQVAETALGNLELALEHPLEVQPSTRLELTGAFIAPTAPHGPETSLLENRTLALTSALSAGRESALLTPGVSGLRLAASLAHEHGRFTFLAGADVPVLVRLTDGSLPAETETHGLGVLPELELKAAFRFTSWFTASLGAGLVSEPWRVQEPARERERRRRLQAVVDPGIDFRLGKAVALGVDGDVPIGGNLGGKAWSVALRGRVAF